MPLIRINWSVSLNKGHSVSLSHCLCLCVVHSACYLQAIHLDIRQVLPAEHWRSGDPHPLICAILNGCRWQSGAVDIDGDPPEINGFIFFYFFYFFLFMCSRWTMCSLWGAIGDRLCDANRVIIYRRRLRIEMARQLNVPKNNDRLRFSFFTKRGGG